MDYTQSNGFVVDAGTGFNRHEDNAAVPTAVTEKDMNQTIWSLMELVKAGGHVGIQFDETNAATYKLLAKALRAAYGGNVTTLNFANSPLVLTKDNAGLVLVDAAGGNVSATLPAANVLTQPVVLKFVRIDATSNTATFSCAGADTLVGGAVSFGLSGQGAFRSMLGDAVSAWATIASSSAGLGRIASLTATVAANALTGTLAAETLDFRSTALTSGVPVSRLAPAAVALVVPSGATLGMVANQTARLVWGWVDNAGTLEPFVCNLTGGLNLDETTLLTTTALTAASDSDNVVYTAVARAGVAFRVRGFCDIAEAVPGTYATAPTLVQGIGGQALAALSSLGYGQTLQNLTASRALSTTYYNTTGKPISVHVEATINLAGNKLNLNVDGQNIPGSLSASSGTSVVSGVIPPGKSYSVVPTVAGTLETWRELR